MSSSSKPTGAHYALVVFVLISIVCGLGWLLAYKGANSISELEARAREEKRKADEQTQLVKGLQDDLQRIKDLLNSGFSEVGDRATPRTVLWDMNEHIKTYGDGSVGDTYDSVLVKLNELKRNTTVSRDKLQEQLETELEQFKLQVEELNAQLGVEKDSRDTANRDKVAADIAYQESSTKRDADIVELRKAIAAVQQQAEEDRAAAEQTIAGQKQRITSLAAINNQLTAELDQKSSPIFNKPNGEVRFVDHVAKRVWVNLGKADSLKPQTTFSVYQKQHSGVGNSTGKGQFGAQDIKGAIEITRVVNSNLSEGKIVGENIRKPIAKGDPIYSPLWSSGRGEAFSLVGIMDLDGDGKDDRDLLLAQIRTAGGVVDNDVDENGILRIKGAVPDDGKPRITERTRYIVIGKLPEIARAADPGQMARAQKILGLRKELEDIGRERGVRVLSLGEFLNYIGYVPQRRLIVPGSNPRVTPKSNSASPAGGKTNAGNSEGKSPTPKPTTSTKIFRQ